MKRDTLTRSAIEKEIGILTGIVRLFDPSVPKQRLRIVSVPAEQGEANWTALVPDGHPKRDKLLAAVALVQKNFDLKLH